MNWYVRCCQSLERLNVAKTVQSVGAITVAATTLEAALDAINDVSPVISWGKFAGNTYVVYDASGTTGAVANSDVVLKIIGEHDLSLSSLDTGAILTYTELL